MLFCFLIFLFSLLVFRFSTFGLRPTSKFCMSKCYFCQVKSRIWKAFFFFFFFFTFLAFRFSTFGLRPNINLSRCRIASSERQNSEPEYIKSRMSKCYFDFRFSKCYFDIRAEPEYLASNLKVLFFVFRFFDIRAEAEYEVLNVKMLFWHSSRCRISSSQCQKTTLTIQQSPIIIMSRMSKCDFVFQFSLFVFWHSDWGRPILFWHSSRCRISSSEFWHSSRARIYRLECQNAILFFVFHFSFSFFTFRFSTFGLRPNIKFLMSKWISNSECQKHILTFQKNTKMYKTLLGKSRECHNHNPQPTPDTKRKRKKTKTNTCKTNKQTNAREANSQLPLHQARWSQCY